MFWYCAVSPSGTVPTQAGKTSVVWVAGRLQTVWPLAGTLIASQHSMRPSLRFSHLAPLAAILVQAAISRSREYEADKAGAEISGRPLWLASALSRIDEAAKGIENYPAAANPATAHMFIVNPLRGGQGFNMAGLFATHPSTADRIARLRAMAGQTQTPNAKGPWG